MERDPFTCASSSACACGPVMRGGIRPRREIGPVGGCIEMLSRACVVTLAERDEAHPPIRFARARAEQRTIAETACAGEIVGGDAFDDGVDLRTRACRVAWRRAGCAVGNAHACGFWLRRRGADGAASAATAAMRARILRALIDDRRNAEIAVAAQPIGEFGIARAIRAVGEHAAARDTHEAIVFDSGKLLARAIPIVVFNRGERSRVMARVVFGERDDAGLFGFLRPRARRCRHRGAGRGEGEAKRVHRSPKQTQGRASRFRLSSSAHASSFIRSAQASRFSCGRRSRYAG